MVDRLAGWCLNVLMDLREAQSFATDNMDKLGLTAQGWTFKFDRAKKRFGFCDGLTRTVYLSRPLTELNDVTQVEDTILHEIAHALVGNSHGHDKVWKAKARELGATPRAADSSGRVPVGRYQAVCLRCGWESRKRYHRRNRGVCPVCAKNKVGVPEGGFTDYDAYLDWRAENEVAYIDTTEVEIGYA